MYLSIILKKKIPLILFIIFLFGVGFYIYSEFIHIPSHTTDMEFRVAVDPGHGSIDIGTHHNQIYEKEINLIVAKKLEKKLKDVNIIPILTRTEDKLHQNSRRKDLRYRPTYANQKKSDLFISIHVNNYPTSAPAGAQVFYKPGSVKSKMLAELIKTDMIKLRKENDRSTSPGNYYVLKNADCPAVLIEMGFISNQNDRKLLADSGYQEKIAESIRDGIIRYFREELNTGIREADKDNKDRKQKNDQDIYVNSNLRIYYLKSSNKKFKLTGTNFIYPTGSFLNTDLNKYNVKEFKALSSINQLLKPPPHLLSPLPIGTRILDVKVIENLAIIDFSSELKQNFHGGARMEQLTVNAITKTLCSIPGITDVKILIDGQPEQSIGGHIIL